MTYHYFQKIMKEKECGAMKVIVWFSSLINSLDWCCNRRKTSFKKLSQWFPSSLSRTALFFLPGVSDIRYFHYLLLFRILTSGFQSFKNHILSQMRYTEARSTIEWILPIIITGNKSNIVGDKAKPLQFISILTHTAGMGIDTQYTNTTLEVEHMKISHVLSKIEKT